MARVALLFAVPLVGAIQSSPSTNAQTDWEATAVPPEGLKLGNETLTWGEDRGLKTLVHGNHIVASSQYTPRTYPAFTLLSRWTSPQTNAVLLQADAIASKDCASYYVIESRMPGAVVSHALGEACVGMTGPSIARNSEGFVFAEAPRPFVEAEAKQWNALTGDIVASKVSWRPRSGTTMAGFVADSRGPYAGPLDVAEFFSAVTLLPKLQQNRLVDALSQVDNGCPLCGGSAQKELYGAIVSEHMAAFSGCGWYMNGGWLECGSSDALAVWDRESSAFYFATDSHRDNGVHDNDATLMVSPELSSWSPAARDKFEIWRNGRPWAK